jgi:hypothetical protein
MLVNDETLHKALTDLAQIRHAIERSRGRAGEALLSSVSIDFHLILQGGAMLSAMIFLVFELVTRGSQTELLLLSKLDRNLQVSGMAGVAVLLILLVSLCYMIVRAGARKAGEDADSFISRNFFYLKNLSLVSDLFIKFSLFTMIVFANKPEWVGPLLMLFIGDYAFQGRLFTLPSGLSIGCGLLSLLLAGVSFFYGCSTLTAPLALFIVVAGVSVSQLLRLRLKISAKVSEQV